MKRTYKLTCLALFFGLFMAGSWSAPAALAQESEKETAKTIIEIKDGKVYLNGEEVAEIEDADLPIMFKRQNKNGEDVSWIADVWADRINSNAFFSDDGEGRLTVRGVPGAYGFVSRDGNNNFELYRERDGEAAFEISTMARRLAEQGAGNYVVDVESKAPHVFLNGFYNGMGAENLEAERRSREVARMLRRGEGDEAELEAELDELLNEVFQAKQETQQERVDRLREQLAELEERVAQRRADREEIIQKRKNELLGRGDRYDW